MSDVLGFMSLIIAFTIIGVLAMKHREIAGPLMIAVSARAALAILDAYFYPIPGIIDSMHFDAYGYYFARNGFWGTFEYIQTGADSYSWVVSVFYSLFERSPLMMQGVNVLFGTLIVLNVYKLAWLLGENAALAKRAAWVASLCPSLVMFSSVLLREVAVAYPLSLGVVQFVAWYKERKHYQLLAAVLAFVVSMAFHSGGLAVLFGAGAWFVWNWLRSIVTMRFAHFGRDTLALLVGGAGLAFVLSSGFGMDKFKSVESDQLAGLTTQQTAYAHGRTAYLEDLHADSPVDLVWQAPIRLTYFLFAPFPWMLREAPDALGLVDSTIFVALCGRAWRTRKEFARRPAIMVVIGIFFAMALTFAIGVSNYGTAMRHRSKMLPILIGAAMALPLARRREPVPLQALGTRLRA